MSPTIRKVMVWGCVAAQVTFWFFSFNTIRLFTPALDAFVKRAQWTMLPNPTRLLLDNAGLAAAVPLFVIAALSTSVGLVQRRVREEADQLAFALMVQAVFWVLSVTYVGAIRMAAVLPFLHVASR